MSDAKISALPASTTPLAGTEVLPVVQSGATKNVSVANLTAGRSISAASLALTTSPLPATSGGTGASSAFTASGVPYASSTTSLTTGNKLLFNGSALGVGGTPGSFNSTAYLTTSAVDMGLSMYSENTSGKPAVRFLNGLNSAKIWLSGDSTGDLNFAQGHTSTISTFTILGSDDVKVNLGNLVIGTSGKGIDFSAVGQAAGMTSELLDDYEEGTWTPDTSYATFVGAPSSEGTYTKIGRTVVVRGSVTGGTSVAVGATGILVGGLPFTPASNSIGIMAASTNTESGGIRATGPFLVATNNMTPTPSITFTATYFV
jgi:hypothetical protein